MNSVAVVIALALLVTVASGLGYNSYSRYPSIKGNSWNTWASRGGRLFDNGGWDLGHHGVQLLFCVLKTRSIILYNRFNQCSWIYFYLNVKQDIKFISVIFQYRSILSDRKAGISLNNHFHFS
jgi:hypothetical protein